MANAATSTNSVTSRPAKIEAAWAQAFVNFELAMENRFLGHKAGADAVHQEALLAHRNAAGWAAIETPAPDLGALEQKAWIGGIVPGAMSAALNHIFHDLRRLQGKSQR